MQDIFREYIGILHIVYMPVYADCEPVKIQKSYLLLFFGAGAFLVKNPLCPFPPYSLLYSIPSISISISIFGVNFLLDF